MSVRSLLSALALLAAASFALPPVPAIAQETAAYTDEEFSKEELDQILAPIALYPDDLLTNVLIASTYPLEVVQAARWIEEPDHADLKGAALTKALEDEDWDPSVKALTQFPDVLAMMSEQLDWMQKLGDAFIASEADVMDRIQFLREKAEDAGNLESNERQTVTTRSVDGDDYIYIEPAEPEVVYVPVYDPYDVYGPWWYPDYPPYYWAFDDVVYVNHFFWGSGVAIAPTLWAWSRPRWHRHYIHIDRHKYNRIARHKWRHKSDRWRHNARHRRGVKFKSPKAWRKTWRPKRDGGPVRVRLRHDDKKRVRKRDGGHKRIQKRDGGRHFDALRKQGPQPHIDGKRHRDGAKTRRDGGTPKVRVRKRDDHRPRVSKPKPEKKRSFSGPKIKKRDSGPKVRKRSFSGPKIKKRGSNVKKRNPSVKKRSPNVKKRKATGVKKRSSAGKKPSRRKKSFAKPRKRSSSGGKKRSRKSFSGPKKRSSAGKRSRGRSSVKVKRSGGRKAGGHRGGRKSGGKRGGSKGGGKKKRKD